jgi:S1-C subfamily serine protease
MGVISAVSGPWQTWRGGKLDSYIRLDATVFPGTSGGAVVDVRGRLVGIATSALSRIAGLAIPASTVDKTIDVLLEKGGIPRGYVGVSLQAVPMPEAFREKFSLKNEQGMMVLNVEPGSAGDRSGILIGDLVFEIEGKPVESIEDLQSFLGWESIGKTLRVRTIRGGAVTDLNIRVGERGTRGAQ